jgi:hypothetical protein
VCIDVIDPEDIWRFSGKSQFAELPRAGHEPANMILLPKLGAQWRSLRINAMFLCKKY